MPIFVYETNQATKSFEQLEFQLAKSEDERIVVDETAKTFDATGEKSAASINLISNMNALKLLRKKILFLVDVFKNSEKVSQNPDYCRRLSQIVEEVSCLDLALNEN